MTVSPTSAPIRMTLPGMGATSEPCSTAELGSGKRDSATR
ncbi:Uncharacterised protein [Mycobacterium tuberculosis]|uniref:Uncharacterized protein n=1 Tax=Mycobacterium tuberculosis TaxID=1773 RepID=A0A916P7D1_MYCTX|nr:Uncharacterised protein [Mycobacterium tuberculosis]COX37250.1 Uncharacterised protein [Mycobacterium tuberculosis]